MSVHFDDRNKTLCGKVPAKIRYSITANSTPAFLADYWLSWGKSAGQPCKLCVDALYEREYRAAKRAS